MKIALLHTPCSLSNLSSLQYHANHISILFPRQRGSKCRILQQNLHVGVSGKIISGGQNHPCRNDVITRREGLLSLSLLAALASPFITLPQQNALAQGEERMLSLERYNDKTEGFTLLKPSDWKKVDKAGATVLFEDPVVKSNNIGVVVNPIRISSLKEFGTPQVVADKLLQAEKKKPSTNDAQLIRVEQRPIHGDIPLYELEYALDSTRGIKRVLSAVIVASKKLYLLNIAYSDSPEKPLSPSTRMILEQVLDSFDVLT
ncbi:hypothetical protein KI387_020483 [Taxus chinensis]|uniref:PsbP C-terminal domain-containing protein n=1 Tax=Taxus chinensis TaxID=29808 RepID=A0AA38G8E6_TAXCH|nr:hypothetical protein KI387_020483 [Taxus chinensis]